MFRTNIKVALRNLLRNRSYTIINVGGLSAAIAISLIVFLYIRHEITYDTYHVHRDRVYRLANIYATNGEVDKAARSSPNIGPLLQQEYPAIELMCRIRKLPRLKFYGPEAQDYEDPVVLSESSLFGIFSLRLLAGDSATCLSKPNSIVLTKSMAYKYFGMRNPLGDTLVATNQYRYVVTGVIDDLPDNTHHRFKAVVSYNTLKPYDFGDRDGYNVSLWVIRDYTFFRFRKGYDIEEFYAEFPTFYEKYMAKIGRELGDSYYPILEPIHTTHMNPHRLEFDYFTTGNPIYIYAFSAVAAFILLLAVINYMNMATARSTTRSREVGLRKVMGSGRQSLMAQFLGESMLLSLIALLLGLCLVEVVLELTPFNSLMQKNLQLNLLKDPVVLMAGSGLALVVGAVSGFYPAVFLSSFLPVEALRGTRSRSGRGGLALRKGMVVFQFTIAIGVIICTVLMRNQVDYMRNKDLGFKGDNICVIPVNDTITRDHLPQIRAELEKHPGVLATTTARNVPGHSVGRMGIRIIEGECLDQQVLDVMFVGQDYLKGMGLELAQGRNFGPHALTDSSAEYLINQTAARELFQDSALGRRMIWGFEVGPSPKRIGPVVGVVKDFTVHSLHHERRPLVILPAEEPGGLLHIRIRGDSIVQTMDYVQKVWQPNEANGSPFNYFFIDDSFDKLYAADQRHSSLMGILAYICMVISGMGLIGFASYTIEQRRKEIGIRKVMGASATRILLMLFQEISYLVIAASFAGSILAFVVVQIWLGEFAYHAPIPIGTFFFAGISALGIALLTVGFHSIRAARKSPVNALKYE